MNFRKGRKIIGKKKKYIPMDHKKRDIKTAAAIIAIVKGQFLLLMFCILFCRVFELLDLIYRNYFLGRIRVEIKRHYVTHEDNN